MFFPYIIVCLYQDLLNTRLDLQNHWLWGGGVNPAWIGITYGAYFATMCIQTINTAGHLNILKYIIVYNAPCMIRSGATKVFHFMLPSSL